MSKLKVKNNGKFSKLSKKYTRTYKKIFRIKLSKLWFFCCMPSHLFLFFQIFQFLSTSCFFSQNHSYQKEKITYNWTHQQQPTTITWTSNIKKAQEKLANTLAHNRKHTNTQKYSSISNDNNIQILKFQHV